VPFVVAERKDVVVTLDWTDHAQDKQATIAINLHFARRPGRGPLLSIRAESCRLGISEGSFASYTA